MISLKSTINRIIKSLRLVLLSFFFTVFSSCDLDEVAPFLDKSIYNDIETANNYVENKDCFNGRILKNIVKPNIYKSNFVPDDIKEYIENNGYQQIEYSCPVKEHDICIRIMLFNNE